jgi:regulator of replication initiation timing
MRAQQDQQISELNAQVSKLRSENDRLKAELTKVEDEEAKLAANNELLRKAIEQAKVTGKMPSKLPYPPK